MASEQTLYMNHGDGEASYARNSKFQSAGQNWMKPLIEEAVSVMFPAVAAAAPLSGSIVMADLGCSSGPNALALVSTAVDAILSRCRQLEQQRPELCVLLNDLPDNDFNIVAKSFDAFKQSHKDSIPLATALVPGSFYERLFASHSVHLVLSSNSLHWLSQAPSDLVKGGIPVYDSDDNLRKARRPMVLKAYAQQFRRDFTLFLSLRAKEMVPGGQMVFSVVGRHFDEASQPTYASDLVALALNDMASRGVIDREKINSFYLPLYEPFDKEVTETIEDEGSFGVNHIQLHECSQGLLKPKMLAFAMRAIFEPAIVQHFGSREIMDEFVRTIEHTFSSRSAQEVAAENPVVFIGVSLVRKI